MIFMLNLGFSIYFAWNDPLLFLSETPVFITYCCLQNFKENLANQLHEMDYLMTVFCPFTHLLARLL